MTSASPEKPADSTPVPPSDNPLDAPEGPRPKDGETEDGADKDEEMAEAEEEVEENGSPAKDAVNEEAQTATDAAPEGQSAQTKATLETSARANLVAQRHAVIVPSYSRWFDMDQINKVERKGLPEFFNNRNRSKTPAVYRDYRDFMINTYRLNPNEYLTVTACRRNLAGDVCAIMRVHAFLEQWGLINYQVSHGYLIPPRTGAQVIPKIDPSSRPSSIGPPFTGHFRVTADTPRGLQTFQPTPNPQLEQGKPNKNAEASMQSNFKDSPSLNRAKMNLDLRRNIYEQKGKDIVTEVPDKQHTNGSTEDKGNENAATGGLTGKQLEEIAKEPKKPIYCNSCGIDCTRIYYHYTKTIPPEVKAPHIDVCPACYADRRYSSMSEGKDYVKNEDPNFAAFPEKNAPWTDSELLLLLEALEKFDDNWNQIADHVGSRTREECVVKFLQLEIEDPYLESDVSGPNYTGLETGRVPFSQGDNPVLSVLGYLAGLSEPNVAAAAGGRAIEEQSKKMRKRLENGIGGSPKVQVTSGDVESAQPNDVVKSEDPMEVDSEVAAHPSGGDAVALAETRADTTQDAMREVANVTFAAAASRAAALASNEEREMTRLVSAAVNATLEKLEIKLQHFSLLEAALQTERRDLERGRQQLFLDRLAFRERVVDTQEALRKAAETGGEEGAKMAETIAVGGGEVVAFEDEKTKESAQAARSLSAEGQSYSNFEI